MKRIGLMAGTVLLSIISFSATSQSLVSEKSVIKKTYPYSDPDPVAKPRASIYPYFRFDGYTNNSVDKAWKVVELENPYIKLTIYPEVGGKVWGAIEKKSGAEFLYDNSVVAFREVAMRGAWTSGGVEFNFGVIGHSPATSSPVDYNVRKNADGSVSCFVGTTDLLTRTSWNVEIKLEPNKAYFTTSTYWYNTQPLIAPFYQWSTAAYPVSDGLEFSFPGSYYIEHSGKTDGWIHDSAGRDISWYKNNNFGGPKSYHVAGALADYFGGYYHDKGWGSVHSSATGEKLGMKVWIWGLSREGMIWEDLLTDTDGQYTEWQSGKLYNQEGGDSYLTPFKHSGFAPNASEEFLEYWYPTLSTEGIAASNQYGTLNYKYENGAYKIFFSPLQTINESLIVTCDGKTIFEEKIAVEPLELWTKILPTTPKGELKIVLGNGLLAYNPNLQTTTRPRELPKEFNWNSLYGQYTKGRQMIYARQYHQAEQTLAKALQIDPLYAPALVDMASLKYRRGYFVEAKELAAKALSLDTYDPQANLAFAVASQAMLQTVDAIDGYTVAAISAPYRTVGMVGAAKNYAIKGEWHKVVYYAERALTSGFNPEAYLLLAVAYRNMGEPQKAEQALLMVEQKMPLNHLITTERVLGGKLAPTALKDGVRAELTHEIFLELGLWYSSIGAVEDALKIYELVPSHPLITYHQAFLTKDKSYLTKAEEQSPLLVFPYRVEMLPVMQWALANSNNWKTRYYTALLYFNLGYEPETAKSLYAELGTEPDFAPFYLSRASMNSPQDAIEDILEAQKIEKSWRVGIALINAYKRMSAADKLMQVATEYHKLYPNNEKVAVGYIEALMANSRYEDALKLMRTIKLLPFEGGTIGRTMFREANLYMAIDSYKKKEYKKALKYVEASQEWIENLGVGKPYEENLDNRSEQYLQAMIYNKMGEKEKGLELIEHVAAKNLPLNSNTILTALALEKLSRNSEANELIDKYQTVHFNGDAARWSKAIFEKNRALAKEIDEQSTMNSLTSPFGTNYQDYGYITIVKQIIDL